MGEDAKKLSAKVAPSPPSNASKYETTNLKEETPNENPDAEDGEQDQNAESKEDAIESTKPGGGFWNANRKVINPYSDAMGRWDQTIMSVLVWTALVTPFEVSFLEPDYNWLFFFNRLIDCVFLTDMGFTFFLDPLNDEKLKENGLPSHRLIAQNYLRGWFTIDVVSCIPFDLVTILLEDAGDDFSKLKFLRAMRLLRLVKLLRLLRVSRIFERWEDRIAINFAMLSLVKSSVGTLLCSHWFGCLWYITAYIEDAESNWVKSTTVDSYENLLSEGVSTFDKYTASWYFSVMTMSTIGYGDISPVTSAERIVCSFMMLIGAGIYAYVVGSITTTVGNMEASSRRYQELMDMLNQFLEMNAISDDLRIQSRAYMRTRQAQGNLTNWQDLLTEMSPDLREAVARETHPGWAISSPFFSNACDDFQAKAASLFTEVTFPRGEKIIEIGQPVDSLYLVKKGVVSVKSQVIRKGGLFGEDIILNHSRPDMRSTYIAMAWTFTVVEALATEQLHDLLEEFPDVKENCRKVLIWQIVREHCWAYASAVRETSGESRLQSARDRELVDHYKWKVKWLRMEGMRAVRVFKAVIRIQKTVRGHWIRQRLNKSKEDGIGAIEMAVKNAVAGGIRELTTRLDSGTDAAILQQISAQLSNLSERLAQLEVQGSQPALPAPSAGASPVPPPLPEKTTE